MNKVMLIGNVGTDPEVRYVDEGVAVARFRFATTEKGYTLQNGTQVPDRTDWHNVLRWRRLITWRCSVPKNQRINSSGLSSTVIQ